VRARRRLIFGGLILALATFVATAQEARVPSAPMVGAYGALEPLDDQAKAVFQQATAGIEDEYTPLSVARQVVAGMNFCFTADRKARGEGAPATRVRIVIYKPLSGAPRITKIEPLP
jgi:hypothetical protein